MNGTRKKKAPSKKKKSFYEGKRTVVHLKLPAAIKEGLRARSEAKDVLLSKIWDEASERLLTKANFGSVIYEHPAKRVDYGTVWIADPLIEGLRKLAKRDDVSLARVIHTAFARYLDEIQK